MPKIEKEIVEQPDILKVFELFLTNMNLLDSEDRKRIIRLLEFICLPRHVVEGKPPIEEDYWTNDKIKESR